VRQHVADGLRCDAFAVQAQQRHVDAARAAVAGTRMNGVAANVVTVFGQVGQVAEIGKRPHHTDGLIAAERFQQFGQRAVCRRVGVATKAHRKQANLLNQRVGIVAFLFANHIAQDASEQADVFDQGALGVE